MRLTKLALLSAAGFFSSLLLATPLSAQDAYFEANGVRIHYVVQGSGEPVVLVHGIQESLDLWMSNGILPNLARDHRVVALDLRGHGKSAKPHDPGAYGREMTFDIVRLLDYLRIRRAHIVGYSLGAHLTSQLLTIYPERFISATLIAGAGRLVWDSASARNAEVEANERARDCISRSLMRRLAPPDEPAPSEDRLVALVAACDSTQDRLALSAMTRSWKGQAIDLETAAAVTVPTLGIVGSRDPFRPQLEMLKKLRPGMSLIVVPNATHAGPDGILGRPELLTALKEFLARNSAQSRPWPDFGPNVTVFDSATSAATIQARLDTIFAAQESSQFGEGRYAVLFKPGTYDVDARIGFYTQVSGLGISPDDVVINGGMRVDARWRKGNATLNFWRVVENMSVVPAGGFDRWAVSQAAPMRRMHIRGDLVLSDSGWSSGGFLADSKVDGEVRSGSQQQWLTRNSALGSWTGSNWNMVFVGTQHAPANSFPDPPYTTIDVAPAIREKPFLFIDRRGEWKVFVPALRTNAEGVTWSSGKPSGVARSLDEFVIVTPRTSEVMNVALALNKSLILTPGIYHLNAPLHVTKANTIVLGLGLATLVADGGISAIKVDDVDGVTLAGLLIEAGPMNSPVLVQVGPPGSSTRHSTNPTMLSDLFVRIGGAGIGKATRSVEINSNDVIGDHLWLWRADHGNGVGWTSNTAANGLVVNGKNVTMYGLFVEHYQQHQVQWNGNGGRTYMFQNEMPYDVPGQAEWMSGATRGFAAYRVDASVTSHLAWGLGSYCFFNRNPTVVADHAFEVPVAPGVRLRNMVTVSLGGGRGTISHVINERGKAARAGETVQKLVSGPGST